MRVDKDFTLVRSCAIMFILPPTRDSSITADPSRPAVRFASLLPPVVSYGIMGSACQINTTRPLQATSFLLFVSCSFSLVRLLHEPMRQTCSMTLMITDQGIRYSTEHSGADVASDKFNFNISRSRSPSSPVSSLINGLRFPLLPSLLVLAGSTSQESGAAHRVQRWHTLRHHVWVSVVAGSLLFHPPRGATPVPLVPESGFTHVEHRCASRTQVCRSRHLLLLLMMIINSINGGKLGTRVPPLTTCLRSSAWGQVATFTYSSGVVRTRPMACGVTALGSCEDIRNWILAQLRGEPLGWGPHTEFPALLPSHTTMAPPPEIFRELACGSINDWRRNSRVGRCGRACRESCAG